VPLEALPLGTVLPLAAAWVGLYVQQREAWAVREEEEASRVAPLASSIP